MGKLFERRLGGRRLVVHSRTMLGVALALGWPAMGGHSVGGRYFYIEAGWSSGPSDVWIEDTQSKLHWDGSGWSRHPYLSLGRGVAFWGDRPDNVWHFGWGVLEHWDGSNWSAVPVI